MLNEPEHKALEDQRMDEFMRQSLEDFRVDPDPGLWKGISRKLLWREILRFNFKNLSARGWLTGATAVVLLGTTLYLFIPENGVSRRTDPWSKPAQTAKSESAGPAKIVTTTTKMAMINRSATPSGSVQGNPQPNLSSTPASPSEKRNATPETYSSTKTGNPDVTTMVSYADVPASADVDIAGETSTIPISYQEEISRFASLGKLRPNMNNLLYIYSPPDTIITIMTHLGPVLVREPGTGDTQFFTASFGVLPERTFYTAPDAYSKMNYWVNGTFSYHISRFNLSTGISLGYVFDQGQYTSEYRSLDSIGYYTSVVSFTVGQNNQLIYNTTTSAIYDSLDHSGDYRTQNRFTYLQVPLLAGFRFADTKRMSLALEAGPAVSFLIGSHYADPVIYYDNGRVIRLEENTPSRTSVNWQLWARLNMSFRVSRQFSFYLEPSGKFFLKPMIDPENVQKMDPWSLGMGIGIQYHFGNKAFHP